MEIIDINLAMVGDKVRFEEEVQGYTIQARNDRYIVCTKPFNATGTVVYSLLDLKENIRSSDNMIFGKYDYKTRESCEAALTDLSNADDCFDLSQTRDIPIKIKSVIPREKYPIEIENIGTDEVLLVSRGIHDPQKFMKAVRDAGYEGSYRHPMQARIKVTPTTKPGCKSLYVFVSKGSHGAFPATYTEPCHADADDSYEKIHGKFLADRKRVRDAAGAREKPTYTIDFSKENALNRINKIIELATGREICCGNIVTELALTMTMTIKYVAHLKESDALKEVRKESNTVFYTYTGAYNPPETGRDFEKPRRSFPAIRPFRHAQDVWFFGPAKKPT